jgi:hypothetical protein
VSTKRDKAWTWVSGLLQAAAPDGVSYPVLEAVLRDVPYDDPYEVVNDWTKEGRVVVTNGEHRLHSRRYTLGPAAAEH